MSFSSSCIVGLRRTFYGNHKCKVSEFLYLLAEFICNKSGIGISREEAVAVFSAQRKNIIFSYHGFSAGQHVEMNAEFFPLRNDFVHLFICQA